MVGWVQWTGGSPHRRLRLEAFRPHSPSQNLGGYLPIFDGGQGVGDEDQAYADCSDEQLPPLGYLAGTGGPRAHPEAFQGDDVWVPPLDWMPVDIFAREELEEQFIEIGWMDDAVDAFEHREHFLRE